MGCMVPVHVGTYFLLGGLPTDIIIIHSQSL